jgi:acyl-coenzyme A synthetase/AMP-(fatty) acid ligase
VAGHKAPKALRRVNRLPRTASGKVRREALATAATEAPAGLRSA